MPWTLFATPLTLHVPRATIIIQKGLGHLNSRHNGCGYPPKKTASETDLRLQRYKLVKSVVGSCHVVSGGVGPLILSFFSTKLRKNSHRSLRSLINNDKYVGKNCQLMMLAFLVHFVLGTSSIYAVGWGLFQSFEVWKKDK